MSTEMYTLEPFPAFVDTVDPAKVSYFSKMGAFHLLSPSGAMILRKKQDNIALDIYNYISLRYYQYEVTFGMYVMTTIEKLIINTMVLSLFMAISYATYCGLQPFLVKSICQVIYYLSGSLAGIEDLCPHPACS